MLPITLMVQFKVSLDRVGRLSLLSLHSLNLSTTLWKHATQFNNMSALAMPTVCSASISVSLTGSQICSLMCSDSNKAKIDQNKFDFYYVIKCQIYQILNHFK